MSNHPRLRPLAGLAIAGVLVLAGCSQASPTVPSPTTPGTSADGTTEPDAQAGGEVVLIAHDSFTFPDDLLAKFEQETGYTLKVTQSGDGGQLANQLTLTKDAPLADAFFGVDNSFISALIDGGVVDPYRPQSLPADAAGFDADAVGSVAPVDHGYVCVNVDDAWFAEKKIAAPATFEDLTDPAYKGLTVVIDPTASSPGAAFLFATVAAFGEDGYEDYWTDLLANDARVDQGWSDAYYTDFSGAGEGGKYPITVSYNTSPAYTVAEGAKDSSTSALLDTCTSQIEYAGVLAGAKNPAGARAVIDFLVSQDFQDTVAETMYMYPVIDAAVPAEWDKWAPLPESSIDLDPADLSAGRTKWLDAWSQLAG
ncbi:thiamine ABC transporter substrate-binding protein [Rarobacter faecitabidus]|uniref:Thiamine transport system substrate-binding protein n=1 Tax=Rarobacter faecitabidus TaxID=13243 RepID=A0A542ZAN0_RARFA|nr:thiamine transport system substrate-binding protein [Rarobacter faecitabidus]